MCRLLPKGGVPMKLREIMTSPVIRIHPDEMVSVAARTFAHYNIGVLPVCAGDGRMCGMVTDRDLVTRCLAAGKSPANTKVRDVMSSRLVQADPDMDASSAAQLMATEQIRRLPIVENGKLCGMVSIGDLAGNRESAISATNALGEITNTLSSRK